MCNILFKKLYINIIIFWIILSLLWKFADIYRNVMFKVMIKMTYNLIFNMYIFYLSLILKFYIF